MLNKPSRLRVCVRGALLVTAIAALALPASAPAAFPGGNGKIAFGSNRDGPFNIYSVNSDGSAPTRLTAGTSDAAPDYSPDGRQIVFHRDFPREIWVMNADGSGGAQNLSNNNAANDSFPAWSPNGSQIVFVSDRDGNDEIYRVNYNGTGLTRLTNDPATDTEPDWSVGGKVAFVSYRTGVTDIYTMNADGSGQTRLPGSVDGFVDFEPDWSPDGMQIAFMSDRDGPPQIYKMNADGSNPTRVITTSTSDAIPAWSPDGRKIAFFRNPTYPEGDFELHVVNADSTGETQLTDNSFEDQGADWQPRALTGYPRPQAAAQFRVPLAVAYRECIAPNRTHGPMLNGMSCNPAVPVSSWLTTGTTDANSFPEQMMGFFRATVCKDGLTATGICTTPASLTSPDVRFEANISDVRCKVGSPTQSACEGTALSDYTGELESEFEFRVTDRHNNVAAGGTGDAGTMFDLPMPVTIACAGNPAGATPTDIGGTCAIVTSMNTVIPGAIRPGKRGVWEIGSVRVFDGGQGGIAGSPDETPFLRQGIFVP